MDECNIETPAAGPQEPEEPKPQGKSEIEELNNKYLRLYAEFDNYRRRVNRDKEEQAKYGNESLVYELLPIMATVPIGLPPSL